ncbi:MAG: hypothetical protein HC807_08545, partial [Gammaproteobacteria bacterium]|nr:hypothetical protein [Gammaproteobacteria bacterium]
MQMGTREGGAFENPFLYVGAWNHSGRILGGDIYDIDRFDEAYARFEELSVRPDPDSLAVTTKPDGSSTGRVKPVPGRAGRAESDEMRADEMTPQTARLDRTGLGGSRGQLPARGSGHAAIAKLTKASVAMDRWATTFAHGFDTGDWAPMRRICAPGMTFEDRRRFALLSGGVELMIASAQERVEMGARPERWQVGQLGDRVVVQRLLWSGGPADGRFEIEYHALMETDEAGLVTAIVLLDDADAAIREAWKRWTAIDPVAARWVHLSSVNMERFNNDWASFATVNQLFAERLIVDDHRRTGMGRIEGRDAYFESLVALHELAPDSPDEARVVLACLRPARRRLGGSALGHPRGRRKVRERIPDPLRHGGRARFAHG